MANDRSKNGRERATGFLRSLARDRAGNTLVLMTAALIPLMGLIGGGVDMSRSYMAQSRLQQACDSGVLAARKLLGSQATTGGAIPDGIAQTGQQFFDANFRDGSYGTTGREFAMTLQGDYSIVGEAKVIVPTTLMRVFGMESVPITVSCGSQLNFSALDVMMVLDVTGSMQWNASGDTIPKLDALKDVIRNFYAQLEASKAPGAKVRYGFVPYATNVNVGGLLRDDWVAPSATYQSRVDSGAMSPAVNRTYGRDWVKVSGDRIEWTTESTYAATYYPAAGADGTGSYVCEGVQPPDTMTYDTVVVDTRVENQTDPFPALLTIETREVTTNGKRYETTLDGSTCTVKSLTDTNYLQRYEHVTEVPSLSNPVWQYKPVTIDTTDWRTASNGCIEERATYAITDFTNVDLTRARDLDIDLVPVPGNADTQWKPHMPNMIYVRKLDMSGDGDIWVPQVTTSDEYADTGTWWFSDCPAPAKKLTEMTQGDLDTYLATLRPYGATYHDIGMIWGARLLSPTGLFSAENGTAGGLQKTRHLIFLTDGQTEPYDISYGTYGVDALDQRRWDRGSGVTLKDTIESRFLFACNEVKKRNVQVWVIAFGTYVNNAMVECAGNGRYFEADNAEELNTAFTSIAKTMADLRITQ